MRILLALAAMASAFLAFPALAETPQTSPVYREGTHYFALPEAVPVQNPDKIEVTEVFWYGCGHCFHFEPQVREWEKSLPGDVNFVKIPAMWNQRMEAHARAYYTARELGILDEVHQALYNALNIDRKPLDSPEAVAEFFADYGAKPEQATEIFQSAAATTFLKEADAKARAYQISGTPQLIVDGKYRIEASQAVPQREMFKVVDFLVNKIRAEKHSNSNS